MIVYLSKSPIDIWKNAYLYRMEEQMKNQWITWLHAIFEDREKAIEMCGIDWFIVLEQDKGNNI